MLMLHTQSFYGSFSGTTRVSRCEKKSSGLYGAREDHRGRHSNNTDGRHSILTNQRPTSIIPPIFTTYALRAAILAWDRHQICWLAYPVAWLYADVTQLTKYNLISSPSITYKACETRNVGQCPT